MIKFYTSKKTISLESVSYISREVVSALISSYELKIIKDIRNLLSLDISDEYFLDSIIQKQKVNYIEDERILSAGVEVDLKNQTFKWL